MGLDTTSARRGRRVTQSTTQIAVVAVVGPLHLPSQGLDALLYPLGDRYSP
jgi:hypothetical protein